MSEEAARTGLIYTFCYKFSQAYYFQNLFKNLN